MAMTKIERLARDICREVGLDVIGVEQRGKHPAIVCKQGRMFFAGSPSDRRYLMNLKRTARQLLVSKAA
jgi:hypothetical protein